MKYLIDSNVLLEVALKRAFHDDAREFLSRTPAADLAIDIFSVHALGFYLVRKTPDIFDALVADLQAREITIVRLELAQLKLVTANAQRFQLTFDDAFVYTVAELHNLTIVSLDADFDRTTRGRRTPRAILDGV